MESKERQKTGEWKTELKKKKEQECKQTNYHKSKFTSISKTYPLFDVVCPEIS